MKHYEKILLKLDVNLEFIEAELYQTLEKGIE